MRQLSRYELGKAAITACRADPRFGYALYVPERYDPARAVPQEFDLIVSVHGSSRFVQSYRDGFVDLAERRGCFVLAPLFPVGVVEQGDVDGYKRLDAHDIRYDTLLLAMIDEVSRRYGAVFRRTMLFGFSGGGQFAHRFAYLHADRLFAVSIGAPGKVTLLDPNYDWWVGTRDVAQRFGRTIDLDVLRRLHVQLVAGAEDTETDEITVTPDSPIWMQGANAAGVTRVDRIRSLHLNLADHGVAAELVLVPGVAHAGIGAVLQSAVAFFDRALAADDEVVRSREHAFNPSR